MGTFGGNWHLWRWQIPLGGDGHLWGQQAPLGTTGTFGGGGHPWRWQEGELVQSLDPFPGDRGAQPTVRGWPLTAARLGDMRCLV